MRLRKPLRRFAARPHLAALVCAAVLAGPAAAQEFRRFPTFENSLGAFALQDQRFMDGAEKDLVRSVGGVYGFRISMVEMILWLALDHQPSYQGLRVGDVILLDFMVGRQSSPYATGDETGETMYDLRMEWGVQAAYAVGALDVGARSGLALTGDMDFPPAFLAGFVRYRSLSAELIATGTGYRRATLRMHRGLLSVGLQGEYASDRSGIREDRTVGTGLFLALGG